MTQWFSAIFASVSNYLNGSWKIVSGQINIFNRVCVGAMAYLSMTDVLTNTIHESVFDV